MTRLKPECVNDELLFERLAVHTRLTGRELKARFGYLIGIGARPFSA
jgi:hypothetical protein